MKESKITINISVADNINELPETEVKLVNAACDATKNSYAIYSQFNVGVAVLLGNGEIIKGSNQENMAYPSGLCAERVAMYYANSQYPGEPIVAIAIASAINGVLNDKPVYPCGACRQALLQSEMRHDKPIKVIMYGNSMIQIVPDIKSLLPLSFDLDSYK